MLSIPVDPKNYPGRYHENLPKVFVIGHNKTATESISHLFRGAQYRAIHWDKGSLARIIRSNLQSNLPLLDRIDDYHCYSDMELLGKFYCNELFPLFDLQYKNSIFIYNYRSVTKWIESRKNHYDYLSDYQRRFNSRNQESQLKSAEDVERHWKDLYTRHQNVVWDYFRGRNNLILLNIESKVSQQNAINKLADVGFNFDKSCTILPVLGARRANQNY